MVEVSSPPLVLFLPLILLQMIPRELLLCPLPHPLLILLLFHPCLPPGPLLTLQLLPPPLLLLIRFIFRVVKKKLSSRFFL